MNRRLRIRWPAVAVAVLSAGAAVAVAISTLPASGGRIANGRLHLAGRLTRSPEPYVRGRGAYGAAGRSRIDLAEPVSGALMGPLSPVAVSSPNGRFVAYNAWREQRTVDPALSFSKQGIKEGEAIATPSLHVVDGASGRDELLASGAYSVAWRDDGAVAYVDGASPSFAAGREYLGRVLVRRGLHAAPAVWTADPARYVVYGWAGSRLLVYRIGEGEHLDTFVLDGPGRLRLLAPGAVVALSPDGGKAFVVSPEGSSVRVLDVATGAENAALDVRSANPGIEWVAYSGSWAGDRVVASTNRGLAVFRVRPTAIDLEQVLDLPGETVQEPRFTGDGEREVEAVLSAGGDGAGTNALIDCDRVSRSCSRGEPAPARDWLRLVDNPSRSAGGAQ